MVKPCVSVLALMLLHGACALAVTADPYPAWRSAATRTLASRGDSGSLTAAAALTFLGPPSRSKAESAKAASAALGLAVKASALAPDDAAISWVRLQLCTYAPGCDVRDAATTMRWVAADNSAAWLPTLAVAQKDKDSMEVDRVLASMAEGAHFDLYPNRTAVVMFDALKRVRTHLPPRYLTSDLARLNEAKGIADAVLLPSFSPLINACRDPSATAERRDDCLALAKTMQRSDTVMAQLVGFAIEKRLTPSDTKEVRMIGERRRLLEWRTTAADQSDEPLLPWLRNVRARSQLAKMRAMPREEDVSIAILRELEIPLDPPEDQR